MHASMRGVSGFACALALVTALHACAQPPVREQLVPDAANWDVAAMRACSLQPSPEVLAAAAPTPAQQAYVQRVNFLETALTGQALVAGNRVGLLIDGPRTHDAQLAEIAKARHHVHLVVYIFTDDAIGQRYLAEFQRLRKRGVAVRVMFDAMGGREAGDKFRKQLEEAGVELFEVGPLNPAEDPGNWEISHRNHRKILIVDGKVAFTGGINISDQYKTSPGASRTTAGWRDTNVRIDGPAVADFQRLFLESWEAGRGPVPKEGLFPKIAPAGHELVRAVAHEGKDLSEVLLAPLTGIIHREGAREDNDIYGSYLAAIGEARSRVWITQAYFVPNEGFLDVLDRAAKRGVDVRLLVPGYTDIQTMLRASHYHYEDLLERGVRIFEYSKPEAVLHAKTAVIDGVWATVGSSNLDYRSFIHNDEANAIVIGADFAGQMEQMFREDLAASREIKLAEWRKRPLKEKLLERWAVLFKYWI